MAARARRDPRNGGYSGMVKLIKKGVYYTEGRIVKEAQAFFTSDKKEAAVKTPSPMPS